MSMHYSKSTARLCQTFSYEKACDKTLTNFLSIFFSAQFQKSSDVNLVSDSKTCDQHRGKQYLNVPYLGMLRRRDQRLSELFWFRFMQGV